MTTLQLCRNLKIHKSRLYRIMHRAGVMPTQRIERGHVVNDFGADDARKIMMLTLGAMTYREYRRASNLR